MTQLATPSPSAHLSTLRLHQLRLGELEGAAAHAARDHLASCPTCAARLDHQVEARAAFSTMPMPAALLPQPAAPGWLERAQAWWAALTLPQAGAFVLAPAMVAVLVVALPARPPAGDGLRTKGAETTLEAWVQSGGSARPLYNGEALRSGSRVQLRYDPGPHPYVTLAGRDGAGRVEIYGTVAAAGPGVQSAPFALTLDDTRGAQSFYAVLTETRPDADALVEQLAVDPLSVEGAEVEVLVVPKE